MSGRLRQILLLLLPGVAFGTIAVIWGNLVPPVRHEIPAWYSKWIEPRFPAGTYKSWRRERDLIVGQTEPWPHKHQRANSYLRNVASFEGDVDVVIEAKFVMTRFPRGRYLACYLCFEPVEGARPDQGSGYWLATGHGVGDSPDQAYIKIVHNGEWEVMEEAPLEIVGDRWYEIIFRRRGNELAVVVDGKPVVTWSNAEFHRGHVQLRLHNSEVEIRKTEVVQPQSVGLLQGNQSHMSSRRANIENGG